jgi:hypothetical protein
MLLINGGVTTKAVTSFFAYSTPTVKSSPEARVRRSNFSETSSLPLEIPVESILAMPLATSWASPVILASSASA